MRRTLMNKMLILSERDVRQALSMADCLDANRLAFVSLATKHAQVPTRLALKYEKQPSTTSEEDWTLFKPAAYLNDEHVTEQMAVKVVSVRADNPSHGLPLVPATLMSLNAETGQVDAVVSATYLSAARTAAGSALATAVAKPELQNLVVFGAGLQAELHLQAISTALGRSISHTTIINRTLERAVQLQSKITDWTTDSAMVALDDALGVAEALSTADCIVTCTNTSTPLFEDNGLIPSGCHINGIGSYTPGMQEVPARTVDRCRVWMDTWEAREVGDLKSLSIQHPVCLLGDVLREQEPDYNTQALARCDCTFFKSVGTAIQDVLTASRVVQRAREMGIGTDVDMS